MPAGHSIELPTRPHQRPQPTPNPNPDPTGITIQKTGDTDGSGNLLTTEAGSSTTFTVVLDAQPTADVTVSITGNDATENSLSTDTLTFSSSNWNTPQSITIIGVDDTLVDGDITTTLTATASNTGGYSGTESAIFNIINQDIIPPRLRYERDNNSFTVEGNNGTGLWLQLKATESKTNWQNCLNVHSTGHDAMTSIGATRGSHNLGFTEIFVAAGETISFSQHSNASNFNDLPSLPISTKDSGYSLALNDNNTDDDFNDLAIDISSSLSPFHPDNYALASQQISSAAAVYDFSSISDSGLSIELSINSDCGFINQLAFVALAVDPISGLPYSDYRIGTITPENHGAYKAAILDNLVHPNGQTITATGQQNQTAYWNLTPEEAGFYAPVLITPGQEVFTAGLLSSSDGNQHTKLLGQNFVGFKDLLTSQQSDWDFNDVTVLATVMT